MSNLNNKTVAIETSHVWPLSSKPARIAETLILGSLGAVVLTLIATTTHTGGLMLDLKNQSPEVVRISLIYFSLAVTGFLVSLGLTAKGRTIWASILLAITCIVYGIALNGSRRISDLRQSQRTETTVDPLLTLNISGTSATGADMWINGEYLSKTPIQIRLSEFLDRIPDWEQPPEDQLSKEAQAVDSKNITNFVRYHFDKRWTRMRLPYPEHLKRLEKSLVEKLKARKSQMAFVRVKLDGHDGLTTGGGGGGSSDGGVHYAMGIGFRFPHREAALERLLDQARLADYQVRGPWFKAMEPFGSDGLLAVREAIAIEPKMEQVLNAWANWKYGMNDSNFSADTMKILDSIAQEADESGQYLSASIAGHAVEELGPRADIRVLAEQAKRLIRETTSISWGKHEIAGKTYWSIRREGAVSSGGGSGRSGSGISSWGNNKELGPSGAVVIHAIDSYLRHHDRDSTEWVRDQISSELIRSKRTHFFSYPQLPAMIGGATTEKYLIRKTLRVPWKNTTYDLGESLQGFGGMDLNRWWYMAANIDSAEGRKFRRRNRDKIMDMTDDIVRTSHFMNDFTKNVQYLFLDKRKDGEQGFAYLYWPRFSALMESKFEHSSLEGKVAYLIAAEPLFPASEYVEVWLAAPEHSQPGYRLKDLRKLPVAKRIEVLDALREIQNMDQRKIPKWAVPSKYNERKFFRDLATERYQEIDDQVAAEHILGKLREKKQAKWFQNWAKEYAGKKPVLLAALIAAKEPDIKLIGIKALRSYPTPANQNLLKPLLNSSDESVQQAAKEVQKAWDELAKTAP